MEEELNPILKAQMEEDKNKIFEIATAYKKFAEELDNKGKDEKQSNKLFIISKEFVDSFKRNIKYEENKELFTENDKSEENLTKFKENLKDLTLEDIEEILYIEELKFYGDLEEIQNDITKGFEFVDYNFLDKYGFENFDEFLVNYYREKNNICIIFNDKSKLLINEDENGEKKYHAIAPPYDKKKIELGVTIKRTKTVAYLKNKKNKTKIETLLKKNISKTLKVDEQ